MFFIIISTIEIKYISTLSIIESTHVIINNNKGGSQQKHENNKFYLLSFIHHNPIELTIFPIGNSNTLYSH
jgi:predicted polyphosphate/ATP-dependent NAD kinase